MGWLERIGSIVRRTQAERCLDEELQHHIELKTRENIEAGMSPEGARYAALRAFGGFEQKKEQCRDADRLRWLEDIIQDVKYGLRQLRRNPGFVATVVITLALGIGGNTAMFSVVNAVLLRPLPLNKPDRIVSINGIAPYEFKVGSRPGFAWKSWAKGTNTLEEISTYATGQVNWSGHGEPIRVPAAEVSGAFFRTLGVGPVRGRTFSSSEESATHPGVVIVSYGLWKSLWQLNPHVIGQVIQLNGSPFTIMGIMPKGFNFPDRSQLWLPFPMYFSAQMFGGNTFNLNALARLRPGFAIQQASAEMEVIAKRDAAKEKLHLAPAVQVMSLHQALVGDIRPVLLLLLGAVGLVLLIACADVANLMLSRNTERLREVAVRAALGASRPRVVRQLLTESVLLSLVGGAFGLLLGWWGVSAARMLIPSWVPLISGIGLDGGVLAFTCVVGLATGVIAGLIPALRSTKITLTETLKEGGVGSRASSGMGLVRLRSTFGIAEIALAFTLLVGAVLLIRSFADLIRVKPGFRTDHLLTTQLTLLGPAYSSSAGRREFYDRVLRRVRALPGVESVSFANAIPFSGHSWTMMLLQAEGHPMPTKIDMQHGPMAVYTEVSRGYFRNIGIPLLSGRGFLPADAAPSSQVAVINQAMAKRMWPNRDPLGKQFRVAGFGHNPWDRVIGVVADIHGARLSMEPWPQAYFLMESHPQSTAYLLVRTAGKPSAFAGSLRKVIHSVDKDEPVSSFYTIDQLLSQSLASRRIRMVLLGTFAGLALLLAAAGVYGIVSYSVSQRTHEIGIRLAIGAQRSDIVRLVLREAMLMTLIGVAIGTVGAFGLSRFLHDLLYGVKPTDTSTFLIVTVVMAGIALAACLIPARRATKVDPMVVRRYE
jgi:predicted permease